MSTKGKDLHVGEWMVVRKAGRVGSPDKGSIDRSEEKSE